MRLGGVGTEQQAVGDLLVGQADGDQLSPALAAIFGDWNWWMPDSLGRLFRVRPSSSVAH